MIRRIPVALFILFTGIGSVRAHPADEILSHVPPGTTVCFIVRDLAERVKQINESPFAAWFEKSELAKRVMAMIDGHKPDQFEKQLKDQFGLTAEELLTNVFGDALVFAYSPAPPGQPDRERALILVKPRKPEVAEKFLAKLDELQVQGGGLPRQAFCERLGQR